MKKLLLITYHFPPSAASGAFRLLGFARHLPRSGWQPIVIAPPTLPWEPVDARLAEQIPAEAMVEPVPYPAGAPKLLRKFAQYAIWLPRAWSACKRLAALHRPDVILTSGPPHCVHLLGQWLQQATGLPWVADFRDPWITDGNNRKLGWLARWTLRYERRVFQHASLILANAPNACRLYQESYPEHARKIVTLTNGFDPRPRTMQSLREDAAIRLLHAGEIYAGRDPQPLLKAIDALQKTRPYRLEILGRCEKNALLSPPEFVAMLGQRSYQETLDTMDQADILVLFDSPGRKIGVPAKLYEYLGARRPILALAEPDGDVAHVLRESGVVHRIASPKDPDAIREALGELSEMIDEEPGDLRRLECFTRESLTRSLASRLDALTGKPTEVAIDAHLMEATQ